MYRPFVRPSQAQRSVQGPTNGGCGGLTASSTVASWSSARPSSLGAAGPAATAAPAACVRVTLPSRQGPEDDAGGLAPGGAGRGPSCHSEQPGPDSHAFAMAANRRRAVLHMAADTSGAARAAARTFTAVGWVPGWRCCWRRPGVRASACAQASRPEFDAAPRSACRTPAKHRCVGMPCIRTSAESIACGGDPSSLRSDRAGPAPTPSRRRWSAGGRSGGRGRQAAR